MEASSSDDALCAWARPAPPTIVAEASAALAARLAKWVLRVSRVLPTRRNAASSDRHEPFYVTPTTFSAHDYGHISKLCPANTSLRMRHITSHRRKLFSAYYRDGVRFGASARPAGPGGAGPRRGRPHGRPAPGARTGRDGPPKG